MGALTIMEIVLLVVSIICFAVSFMIPEKKPEGSGIDQELAKEEVKEMVRQEVDSIRGHVDDVVKESMDYAMEKTERSLERLSNEKIMAVNEYSDSVMQEIHKNHEEVVFLYDMLNNKHDSLKKTVAEASKAAKVMQDSVESIQSFRPVAVSYGEGSVKIAPLASKLQEERDADRKKKGSETDSSVERKEKETKESLKNWKPEIKPYSVPDSNRIVMETVQEEMPFISEDSQSGIIHETRPIFGDHVMAGREESVLEYSDGNESSGVEGPENGTQIHLEGDASRNQNNKILELHGQGKSNVAIAKELGLGVGEVKLVVDLYTNV